MSSRRRHLPRAQVVVDEVLRDLVDAMPAPSGACGPCRSHGADAFAKSSVRAAAERGPVFPSRNSSSERAARASRRARRSLPCRAGDFSFSVFNAACAKSEPSSCKAAPMSPRSSQANSASIFACSAATGPAVSPLENRLDQLADVGRSVAGAPSSAPRAGTAISMTTPPYRPTLHGSHPAVHGLPVNPKQVPISPGERDSSQVPPTSGKKPRLTSGIASPVFSVTTRWLDAPTGRRRRPSRCRP